ncbi:hypothetical protein T440DRAFT_421094 [Plenodomus tracheiphilus IPT5]|uniref:WD40 repeat-like protein n=1 Tax=Plenodomus tracheiphilus IPT5 TaxID=1408161 RepID=A0A6A7B9Q5_9PLEO|nr:hypothetical protein T440DRAFT_421094 [Plenodomus tracheiphilus IPT5]
MSEEPPTRRQSRAKRPQSYRLDDEYSFLDEDASAPSGSQTPVTRRNDESDEDDFMPDAAEEEPEDEEYNEDNVDDDDGEQEYEKGSDEEYDGPRRASVQEIEFDSNRDPHPYLTKHKKKPPADVHSPIAFAKGSGIRVQNTDYRLRTRGVADFSKAGGQEVRLKDLFGPDNDALGPILATRDYWYEQETLPLRRPGGCRRSFFESPESRAKEESSIRAWYAETGWNTFIQNQKTQILTAATGQKYMANDGAQALNVLWGAAQSPRVRTFEKGACVTVNEAFEDPDSRRGWMFYMGARIQDTQWAPNEEGNVQYIAVAVEQKPIGGWQPKPLEEPKAPAFSATASYPASIQIWAFDMTSNEEDEPLREPRLQQVICTDWGAPKQLRWSPIKATETADNNEDTNEHIGLLAGIWSDGRVRILDVKRPLAEDLEDGPAYVHYAHAAFDISIPDTVPSCLHWLSASSLAVATAAGTTAIWTITRPGTLTTNAKPWFYRQLADTYIVTISSGWPSQPHLLSISIADGFARLFDLRCPTVDTTASIRGRTLCISQAWHEHTQTFVMPDEHFILKHTPIRRYYHNLYSMRLDSSITRVATSPVHPTLLVAGAEGDIEASVPIGRITNYKIIPWQQKWFLHEWRRPVEELAVKVPVIEDEDMPDTEATETPGTPASETDNTAASKAKKVPQEILSQPLVRITEGFKAIQPGIQHSIMSKKPNNPETNKGITVYEANSAITALSWNPNLKYGTWAVAGMADGLMRVEDIGV